MLGDQRETCQQLHKITPARALAEFLVGSSVDGSHLLKRGGPMSIYKLWQGRFTEAWYRLPQDEQQRLMGEVTRALDQTAGKRMVTCLSAWSNERWQAFGVEQFPDIEAVQRHEQILMDLAWARYFESQSTLGTEFTA